MNSAYNIEDRSEREVNVLEQILDLRDYTENPQRRGHDFEQLVRDLPLWENRPYYRPRSRRFKEDQIDSVFTWNGITFLLEAKSEINPMTAGSEKWKSYKDKLTSRADMGGVIGVFASHFAVDDSIYESGKNLNIRGVQNIVLAGDFWDQLLSSDVSFAVILEIMIQEVRVSHDPKPPQPKTVLEKLIDGAAVSQLLLSKVHRSNADFLHRFEHDKHSEVYVKRRIDKSIKDYIKQLRPSILKRKAKKNVYQDPIQTHLIRDYSGSGKTTLSCQIVKLNSECIPISINASDERIDKILSDLIFENSNTTILKSLQWIDRPLLVFIDSLDEVKNLSIKQNEVKSIFKSLDEINIIAKKNKLAKFPILVFFTIRDEYFREWESQFEGRIDNVFKKKISVYSEHEFIEAVDKYSKSYEYKIVNLQTLDQESKSVLSIPINLEIFSIANRYKGEISIFNIWESKILHKYFEVKNEHLHKRNLGFSHQLYFYPTLCSLAVNILEVNQNGVRYEEFYKIFEEIDSRNKFYTREFWDSLISEEIIVEDFDRKSSFKFKYVRFLEYLLAYAIAEKIRDKKSAASHILTKSLERKDVSIFKIINNLKYCSEKIGVEESKIDDLRRVLVKDNEYLLDHLKYQRYTIANGSSCSDESLIQIKLGASFSEVPEVSLMSFFILAAKKNKQTINTLLEFFEKAWTLNENSRYKLLNKLANHNLLANERTFRKILLSERPLDWESYLGHIIDQELLIEIKPFLITNNVLSIIKFKYDQHPDDWSTSKYLLDVCLGKQEFVLGRSVNEFDDDESNTDLRIDVVNDYYQRICQSYNEVILNSSPIPIEDLSHVEIRKIRFKVEEHLDSQGKNKSEPLFDFLFFQRKSKLISILIRLHTIKVDKEKIKFLVDSVHAIENYQLNEILKAFYDQEFEANSLLIEYCENKMLSSLKEHQECLFMILSYLRLRNHDLYCDLFNNIRPIISIASIKYGVVLHYKYPNLIGVVNNALNSFSDYKSYVYKSIVSYNRLANLESYPSFVKKYEIWKEREEIGIPYSIPLVVQMFPELSY